MEKTGNKLREKLEKLILEEEKKLNSRLIYAKGRLLYYPPKEEKCKDK